MLARRAAALALLSGIVAGISCNEHSVFSPDHLPVSLSIVADVAPSGRELDVIGWYHRVTANTDIQIFK